MAKEPQKVDMPVAFAPDYGVFTAEGVSLTRNPHGGIEFHFWRDQGRPKAASVLVDPSGHGTSHSVETEATRTFQCVVVMPAGAVAAITELIPQLFEDLKKSEGSPEGSS